MPFELILRCCEQQLFIAESLGQEDKGFGSAGGASDLVIISGMWILLADFITFVPVKWKHQVHY